MPDAPIQHPDIPDGLNKEQYKFCQLYAYGANRGNGVLCYGEAYNKDLSEPGVYASCRVGAHRLLTDNNILTYIRDLYETYDLSDVVVDNELAFVIKQNADFGSKVAAIKEYNQLKGRIIKKMELNAGEGVKVVVGKQPEPDGD